MEINNLTENENGSVSFELEVSGEEWRGYLDRASHALQKQKAVPGYRAGKASLGVAARHYGKTLFESAAREANNALFPQACRERDYAPVSQPSLMVITADETKLCTICSFVNYPKVEDLEYRGLKPEKPVKTCSEADVDAAVDRYMHQHLYVHEVPREARMGDIVELSFTGTHEGGPFPYDHAEKSRFVMGSGQLFAGLDELLVGHVAGDELAPSLTMPEDFHRKDIAGMTLDLQVRLKGVWARDLLECTDDYVKENVKGCDTLAEFREKQRKEIQERYDSESRRAYKRNLDAALAATVTCPVPGSMIDTAIGRFVSSLRFMAGQQGMTAEELLRREGRTLQDYVEQVRPAAEQQVRESIALDYVIRAEKLEITGEELLSYFQNYAQGAQISVEEAQRRLGGAEAVYERLLNERAMQIVSDAAEPQIREVEEFPKLF